MEWSARLSLRTRISDLERCQTRAGINPGQLRQLLRPPRELARHQRRADTEEESTARLLARDPSLGLPGVRLSVDIRLELLDDLPELILAMLTGEESP